MASVNTISAEARDRAGKGAARATRRTGRVPGVIYGKNFSPVLISLEPVELNKHLRHAGFFSHVFEVKLNGGEAHRALPRDVQFDPVSDRPIHVDFYRFSADTKVTVEVQVNFINADKSPGLKTGGVLNVVRHGVELRCSPDAIPESLIVNLEGLEIGDSVHISHIQLPPDVRPTITGRDFTIATIAAPSLMQSEDEEKAAADAAAAAATAADAAAAAEGTPAAGGAKDAKSAAAKPDAKAAPAKAAPAKK